MYVATIAYSDAQGAIAETPAIRITGLSYESGDYSWYVRQAQVLLTGGPHQSLLFQLRNEKEDPNVTCYLWLLPFLQFSCNIE